MANAEPGFGRKRIKIHPGLPFVAPVSEYQTYPFRTTIAGVDVCRDKYAKKTSYMFGEGVKEVRGQCGTWFRS